MLSPSSSTTCPTTVGFTFITLLLDIIAVGIMAPVLPKLIIDHREGPCHGRDVLPPVV